MTVRRAIAGVAATSVVLAGVVRAALAAGPATEDQLREMTAVLQSFGTAVAAKDGTRAVDLKSNDSLTKIEKVRDIALTATEAALHDPQVPLLSVMIFRMNFTAVELEGKSGRQLFAALVDKGLAGSPGAARLLSQSRVAKASFTDDPAIDRAHVDIALGDNVEPEAAILVREPAGWRIDSVPTWLSLSDYIPPCMWSLSEKGQNPATDADCGPKMKQAMKPFEDFITAVMAGRDKADQALADLHQPQNFEALMHHSYDPRYWQPMRAVKAN